MGAGVRVAGMAASVLGTSRVPGNAVGVGIQPGVHAVSQITQLSANVSKARLLRNISLRDRQIAQTLVARVGNRLFEHSCYCFVH